MILKSYLRRCVAAGAMRELDFLFAERLTQLGSVGSDNPGLDDPLFAAVALASRAVGEGGSCLDLERISDIWPVLDEEPVPAPIKEVVWAALAASPLCTTAPADAPLVLEFDRLYLLRYARYEADTAERLLQLAGAGPPRPLRSSLLNPSHERALWGANEPTPNWQAIACAVSAAKQLAIISGGPGTGKTHTMVRVLLTLLSEARLAGEPEYRIALAAPTGKAAQRMAEAVRLAVAADGDGAVRRLLVDDWISERLPREASTVHRLLGANPIRGRFRHDENRPLNVDAVVIDEASMLDLPLMTRLLRALRDDARLILIGDRSQLAAVDAGDVFGELFRGIHEYRPGFSREMRRIVHNATAAEVPEESAGPLSDCTVMLERGYRAVGPLSELAAAVNSGDAERTLDLLDGDTDAIAFWSPPDHRSLAARVAASAVGWFDSLRKADSPAGALLAMQRFRLLAAVNRGPYGVEQLNRVIEQALAVHHGFYLGERHYHLRPVLVTRNDYRWRLFNGDLGVIYNDGSGPRAYFEIPKRDDHGQVLADTTLMSLLPTALPEHRTCYAMTVHKSQGSEFDAVTLVLPETDSPVVTRELIYTGITRSRRSLAVWSPRQLLAESIANRHEVRMSGLACRLAGGS